MNSGYFLPIFVKYRRKSHQVTKVWIFSAISYLSISCNEPMAMGSSSKISCDQNILLVLFEESLVIELFETMHTSPWATEYYSYLGRAWERRADRAGGWTWRPSSSGTRTPTRHAALWHHGPWHCAYVPTFAHCLGSKLARWIYWKDTCGQSSQKKEVGQCLEVGAGRGGGGGNKRLSGGGLRWSAAEMWGQKCMYIFENPPPPREGISASITGGGAWKTVK